MFLLFQLEQISYQSCRLINGGQVILEIMRKAGQASPEEIQVRLTQCGGPAPCNFILMRLLLLFHYQGLSLNDK
jgi:hypothetical protein